MFSREVYSESAEISGRREGGADRVGDFIFYSRAKNSALLFFLTTECSLPNPDVILHHETEEAAVHHQIRMMDESNWI